MNFDFLGLKTSLQRMQDELSRIRGENRKVRNKIQEINYAPISREDFKSAVAGWIGESEKNYRVILSEAVLTMARNPVAMKSDGRLRQLVTLGGSGFDSGLGPEPSEIGKMVCGLFGSGIMNLIGQEIDSMSWPEGSLSSAQRKKQIDELEGKLRELIDREESLLQNAAEAGINLE